MPTSVRWWIFREGAGSPALPAAGSEAAEAVFGHGARDFGVDGVDAFERVAVEDEVACGEAFVELGDGGGSEDGGERDGGRSAHRDSRRGRGGQQ